MKNFFSILLGNLKKIIAVAVITCIAATAFGIAYNNKSVSSTLFINIGAVQGESSETSPYETLQAADQFTETVQGWFRNPSFLREIGELSGYKADFSVRKQEKQNLLATFKTEEMNGAERVTSAVKTVLEKRIALYNSVNSGSFTLASYDSFLVDSPLPVWIFPLAGIIIGLFIGYFLSLLRLVILAEYRLYRQGK